MSDQDFHNQPKVDTGLSLDEAMELDRRAAHLRDSAQPVGMHLPPWEDLSEERKESYRRIVLEEDAKHE